jgi:hypothetical protein
MDTTPAAASTAPPCARSKSEGVAPLAGAAAVILFLAGVFIHDVVGDTPDGNDPAAEFARYYQQEDGSIWFASIFIFIALALFLWFVGELRAALRQVESGVGRLAATAQAGGVAAAVLIFAGFGTQVSAAILVSDRDVPIIPRSPSASGGSATGSLSGRSMRPRCWSPRARSYSCAAEHSSRAGSHG